MGQVFRRGTSASLHVLAIHLLEIMSGLGKAGKKLRMQDTEIGDGKISPLSLGASLHEMKDSLGDGSRNADTVMRSAQQIRHCELAWSKVTGFAQYRCTWIRIR